MKREKGKRERRGEEEREKRSGLVIMVKINNNDEGTSMELPLKGD